MTFEKRSTEPIPDQLIEAVARLWASEPPSSLTMRRIAQEAGVSLGLVYNYVPSKEALFAATLVRLGERMAAAAESIDPGAELLDVIGTAMKANRAFPRLGTYLILEGVDVPSHMTRFPVIDMLRASFLERGLPDPELAAGLMAFLVISLDMYEPLVNGAMRRSGADPGLRDALAQMYADWLDGQSRPGS